MNGLVIGKRIPIGMAINGGLTFAAHMYNLYNPETAISIVAVGSLGVFLTALAQVFIVNCFGVTNVRHPKD